MPILGHVRQIASRNAIARSAVLALALASQISAQNCTTVWDDGSYGTESGLTCSWSEMLVYCNGSFQCGMHVTICTDSSGSSGTSYSYDSC